MLHGHGSHESLILSRLTVGVQLLAVVIDQGFNVILALGKLFQHLFNKTETDCGCHSRGQANDHGKHCVLLLYDVILIGYHYAIHALNNTGQT